MILHRVRYTLTGKTRAENVSKIVRGFDHRLLLSNVDIGPFTSIEVTIFSRLSTIFLFDLGVLIYSLKRPQFITTAENT